jgi:hypothetical protein
LREFSVTNIYLRSIRRKPSHSHVNKKRISFDVNDEGTAPRNETGVILVT